MYIFLAAVACISYSQIKLAKPHKFCNLISSVFSPSSGRSHMDPNHVGVFSWSHYVQQTEDIYPKCHGWQTAYLQHNIPKQHLTVCVCVCNKTIPMTAYSDCSVMTEIAPLFATRLICQVCFLLHSENIFIYICLFIYTMAMENTCFLLVCRLAVFSYIRMPLM